MEEKEALGRKASDNAVVISRKKVYKNLLVIGVMQALSYAAINPTLTVLTSVAGNSLGNVVFGLNYIFSCLFSFFTISILDNTASKRKVVLFGCVCILGFTVCNWYISYYTLIFGSLLFGIGATSSWIGSLMYMRKLSVPYAKNYGLSEQGITSYFIGIVLAFSVLGYILGNATTSGLLTLLKSDDDDDDGNSTVFAINSSNFHGGCQTNDDELEFDIVSRNVVRGLVVFYSLLGCGIIAFFLDDVEKLCGVKTVAFCRLQSLVDLPKKIGMNVIPVAKLLAKKEMALSSVLFIAAGSSQSFVFTRYTKTYVTECVGIHVVGYVMMVYGLGNALGSYISGKLLSSQVKTALVLGTLLLHLAVMIFLIIWEREPSVFIIFFVILLWSICDGSWMTVCSSFAASWFKEEKSTHSFALFRIIFLFGLGSSVSLALTTPVKLNLAVLSVLFLIFAPLHLIITYCSGSHQKNSLKVYEIPVFYIDE